MQHSGSSAVHHIIAQRTTSQRSAAQHTTSHHTTTQHNTKQRKIPHHTTPQHNTPQHNKTQRTKRNATLKPNLDIFFSVEKWCNIWHRIPNNRAALWHHGADDRAHKSAGAASPQLGLRDRSDVRAKAPRRSANVPFAKVMCQLPVPTNPPIY